MLNEPADHSETAAKPAEYVVVARRYRPQSFQDLVGQGQVAQALTNAIHTNRVGHAYLFTGARGVGKTSTARILAKCLNCERGPTPTPCNQCDLCQAVSTGDDVDVLEIDGASNRGIDEIRQLRSNINVRPSRSRFKIYIIDEVHMLTVPAFNALLKTLEEPPPHVKFIFCTTDPEKIPITVLSRCQRFDFPPVETESIMDRLRYIVESEKIEAEPEALHMLARRAGGSMRDSQSVLEQLLSFCGNRITVDDVHRLLGTAKGGRLSKLVGHLIERDAAQALAELEVTTHEGVDVGQLAEQLLGYFRDIMAATVGCPADLLLQAMPADFSLLQEAGKKLGLETVLAILQILDQSVSRMRQSTHVRMLLEMALVRICKLENLDELSRVIAQIQSGAPVAAPAVRRVVAAPAMTNGSSSLTSSSPVAPPSPDAQKKTELSSTGPTSPVRAELVSQRATSSTVVQLTNETARQVWNRALDEMGDMTADMARAAERLVVTGGNRIVATFRAEHTLQKQSCERPERKLKIEQMLSEIAGGPVTLEVQQMAAEATPVAPTSPRPPVANRRQKLQEVERLPFVQQAKQMFDAEIVDVIESRRE